MSYQYRWILLDLCRKKYILISYFSHPEKFSKTWVTDDHRGGSGVDGPRSVSEWRTQNGKEGVERAWERGKGGKEKKKIVRKEYREGVGWKGDAGRRRTQVNANGQRRVWREWMRSNAILKGYRRWTRREKWIAKMSKVCTSRRRAPIRRGFRDREILRGSTDSHPSVFAIVFIVASIRVVLSCFVAARGDRWRCWWCCVRWWLIPWKIVEGCDVSRIRGEGKTIRTLLLFY